MLFSKQFLIDSLDENETILDEIVDHSRWTVEHRRIFKHEGKLYETFYSVGATEQQDESPYEYADARIECDEVVPVQKPITVYEKITQGN